MRTSSSIGRRRKLLNVRSLLERIIDLHGFVVKGEERVEKIRAMGRSTEGYLCFPPVYYEELEQMAFLAKQVLKKHEHTRKDVRLEEERD
jgi:hypothetical protein